MAQLRQKEKDFAALKATVACVVSLDFVRTQYFVKNKPGPYVGLSDPASRVSSIYGISKQLVVHDEWVNAPSVFIVKDGKITWSHVGRGFGDRPSMETILDAAGKAK